MRLVCLLLMPALAFALSASFASNHSERTYRNIEEFVAQYTFADLFNEDYNDVINAVIKKLTVLSKVLDEDLMDTKRQLKIITIVNDLRLTLQEFDKATMYEDLTETQRQKYEALLFSRMFTVASSALITLGEKVDMFDTVSIQFPELLYICQRSVEVAEEVEKMKPELRTVSRTLRHAYMLILRLQMEIHNDKLVTKIYEKLAELIHEFSPKDHKDLVRLAESYLEEYEDSEDEKVSPFYSLIQAYKDLILKS